MASDAAEDSTTAIDSEPTVWTSAVAARSYWVFLDATIRVTSGSWILAGEVKQCSKLLLYHTVADSSVVWQSLQSIANSSCNQPTGHLLEALCCIGKLLALATLRMQAKGCPYCTFVSCLEVQLKSEDSVALQWLTIDGESTLQPDSVGSTHASTSY